MKSQLTESYATVPDQHCIVKKYQRVFRFFFIGLDCVQPPETGSVYLLLIYYDIERVILVLRICMQNAVREH